MSKYFLRFGAKKENVEIKVTVCSLDMKPNSNTKVAVIWKRGPATEKTETKDMDAFNDHVEWNQSFVRVSQFHFDVKSNKSLPKMCTFRVVEAEETG